MITAFGIHPSRRAVSNALSRACGDMFQLPWSESMKTGSAPWYTMGLALAANVNVDMIIQNEPVSEGARADMSFTVPRDDLRTAREALEALVAELGSGGVEGPQPRV